MKRVLLIAGFTESLINFRGPLISAMQISGLEVHVASPGLDQAGTIREKLESRGVHVHNVPMRRIGTNPFADFHTLLALCCLMRRVRPHVVLSYTIKPVIYGSLAAWLTRVPRRFALITGLGYAFTEQQAGGLRGIVREVVQKLYRLSLKRVQKVFFQNPDDEVFFRKTGLLDSATASYVTNGSGVDIAEFSVVPLPSKPCFLLIARLLGDKGVREYAEAAKYIKTLHPEITFLLVGWIDENPDAISYAELDSWVSAGSVQYLGRLEDVRPAIEQCSVYVLPSYREGTPRSVLEAMAMGRAIITTDAPGCRETVIHDENGILIPIKSVDALVAAMNMFIENPDKITSMGARSRLIAETKYNVDRVNAVMLHEMGIID